MIYVFQSRRRHLFQATMMAVFHLPSPASACCRCAYPVFSVRHRSRFKCVPPDCAPCARLRLPKARLAFVSGFPRPASMFPLLRTNIAVQDLQCAIRRRSSGFIPAQTSARSDLQRLRRSTLVRPLVFVHSTSAVAQTWQPAEPIRTYGLQGTDT